MSQPATDAPDPRARLDSSVVGVVLAAGAGRRFGQPKGLLRRGDGASWAAHAAGVLRDSGCMPVLVTVGAQGDEVAGTLPPWAVVVPVPGWAEGMGASLRAALEAAAGLEPPPSAAVVTLVDLPDLTPVVVRRLLDAAAGGGGAAYALEGVLARTTWHGRPGHPVLLGREHWAAASAVASGDVGARALLEGLGVVQVECGDLGSGADVDEISDLPD